jgi:ketosteroid isomerase-like protein
MEAESMSANTEQDILTQEENLTQATRQLDIDALDRIYADDIMFTGVTGDICDKSTLLGEARRGVTEREGAAKGSSAVTSYDKEDIRIVAHGDTAVASYRFVITIRNAGQEITRRYRTSNVWMRRDGRWQVIAAQTASLELDLSKLQQVEK